MIDFTGLEMALMFAHGHGELGDYYTDMVQEALGIDREEAAAKRDLAKSALFVAMYGRREISHEDKLNLIRIAERLKNEVHHLRSRREAR